MGDKKGLFNHLKVLSRPAGKAQWKLATRAILLMLIAVLIAYGLGWTNGINVVMFSTLIATLFFDIPLPLRKLFPLIIIAFVITILAFTTASLALSSLTFFIILTAIWSFFSLSIYMFGENIGFIGFLFFCNYFLAVIMVNNQSNTESWILYICLSYLVAAIILIPKIFNRKNNLRKMVAVGFIPTTNVKNIVKLRNALSGIPISVQYHDLFRIGSYLTVLRNVSTITKPQLSPESQATLQNIINTVNNSSTIIANIIINRGSKTSNGGLGDLLNIDLPDNISADEKSFLSDLLKNFSYLIKKSSLILSQSNDDKNIIKSNKISLKDFLVSNFNLKNLYIRHALRFALAMTIALIIVYLTHNRDAIWIAMGVLIIIKPDITSTINNMILRVLFNLFGVIIAIILGFLLPHFILLWIALLMLFFFRAYLISNIGLSVMALTLFVVLIWPTGSIFDNAIARIVDISIGAGIAFLLAYLLFPNRGTMDLTNQISNTIKSSQQYLNAIFSPEGYDHQITVQALGGYLLEDNNLEAGIKKVQDTFNNVDEDVAILENIKAAIESFNIKLSAAAAEIEGNSNYNSIILNKKLDEKLTLIIESVDDSNIPLNSNKISGDGKSKIDKLLSWAESDLNLLAEEIKRSHENGLLNRYRNLW